MSVIPSDMSAVTMDDASMSSLARVAIEAAKEGITVTIGVSPDGKPMLTLGTTGASVCSASPKKDFAVLKDSSQRSLGTAATAAESVSSHHPRSIVSSGTDRRPSSGIPTTLTLSHIQDPDLMEDEDCLQASQRSQRSQLRDVSERSQKTTGSASSAKPKRRSRSRSRTGLGRSKSSSRRLSDATTEKPKQQRSSSNNSRKSMNKRRSSSQSTRLTTATTMGDESERSTPNHQRRRRSSSNQSRVSEKGLEERKGRRRSRSRGAGSSSTTGSTSRRRRSSSNPSRVSKSMSDSKSNTEPTRRTPQRTTSGSQQIRIAERSDKNKTRLRRSRSVQSRLVGSKAEDIRKRSSIQYKEPRMIEQQFLAQCFGSAPAGSATTTTATTDESSDAKPVAAQEQPREQYLQERRLSDHDHSHSSGSSKKVIFDESKNAEYSHHRRMIDPDDPVAMKADPATFSDAVALVSMIVSQKSRGEEQAKAEEEDNLQTKRERRRANRRRHSRQAVAAAAAEIDNSQMQQALDHDDYYYDEVTSTTSSTNTTTKKSKKGAPVPDYLPDFDWACHSHNLEINPEGLDQSQNSPRASFTKAEIEKVTSRINQHSQAGKDLILRMIRSTQMLVRGSDEEGGNYYVTG